MRMQDSEIARIKDLREALNYWQESIAGWKQLCGSRSGHVRGQALNSLRRARQDRAWTARRLHRRLWLNGVTRVAPRTD